jgi:RNA polymerase sigma-70 factor (ECF subfamily)
VNDLQAIREVVAGNSVAFEHIVRGYQRRLCLFVGGKLPASEVEDVVQKTFVTAFRNLHAYDPRQPLYPWLRAIALNHCRNEWKQSERRARLLARVLEERRADLQLGGVQNPDALDEGRVAALRECLQTLSATERQALHLRFVEEMSLQEIGDRLGRSSEAARLFLFRVRARLGKCVQQKLAEQDRPPARDDPRPGAIPCGG